MHINRWRLRRRLGATLATLLTASTVVAAGGAPASAAPPSNDSYATPRALTGPSGTLTGDTTEATMDAAEEAELGFRTAKTVWFSYTAPANGTLNVNTYGTRFDTRLFVYTGPDLASADWVTENDDSGPFYQSEVGFDVVAGTTYHIGLGGYSWSSGLQEGGPFQLAWSNNPVPHDNFANATALQPRNGLAYGVTLDSSRATVQAGEPGGLLHTVWYSYRATTSGLMLADTWRSNGENPVNVYTGASLGALTPVATNKTDTSVPASITATAGTTYWFQVGSATESDTGYVELRLSVRPENDDFANARPVVAGQGETYEVIMDTSLATREAGEPGTATHTLWYAYRAPTSGTVRIDNDTGANSVVAVYTGSSLTSLTPVISGPDTAQFEAVGGTTYWIQVGGVTEGDVGEMWIYFYDTLAVATDGLPTISGAVHVGQTLNADPGTWRPEPTTFTYQWAADGVDIAGATAQTFAVTTAQLGKKLTVTVTGAKVGFATGTATSAPTAAVTVAPVKSLSCTVKVKGKPKVGKKLKAATACTTAGVTMKYQWFRGAKKIKKATKAAYKTTRKDKGKKLSVRVTFSKAGHTTLVKKSKKVRVRR